MKDREEYISILEQDNAELKKQLEERTKMNKNVNVYSFNTKMLIKLLQENKQLKEQLLVAQTNEETFRLEMEDITKILGLDENTLFDDVKVCVKSLKEVSDD